jgi:uncharacterized protein YggE
MRLFITYMTIATALVAAASAVAEPLAPHTVTVEGTAEIQVSPDKATIDIGVVASSATAAAALRANDGEMARVVDAIRSQGISNSGIQTSNFSIDALHPKDKSGSFDYDETVGYQVTNKVTVLVNDLSKVASVIDASVSAGANSSNSVSFDVKDRIAYEQMAEKGAMHNARQVAELLVGEEHRKVGALLAVTTQTGIYNMRPVTAVGQQELKLEGTPVTSILPGKITISSSVTAQYSIE